MTRTRTTRLKRAFLERFRQHGNITAAAADSGLKERRSVYDWKEADPAFAAAFAAAEEEATEHLEAEARRRAVDGLIRKKFDRSGEPIMDPETGQQYVERHYSDTLLVLLLKARSPDKYKDRVANEHSGPGGGPIAQEVTFSAAALRAAEDAYLAAVGLAADLGDGAGDDHPPDTGAAAV